MDGTISVERGQAGAMGTKQPSSHAFGEAQTSRARPSCARGSSYVGAAERTERAMRTGRSHDDRKDHYPRPQPKPQESAIAGKRSHPSWKDQNRGAKPWRLKRPYQLSEAVSSKRTVRPERGRHRRAGQQSVSETVIPARTRIVECGHNDRRDRCAEAGRSPGKGQNP
jgi:hypothetical protein